VFGGLLISAIYRLLSPALTQSGTSKVPALAPDASWSHSRKVGIPSATLPGVYDVQACVDAKLKIPELDETNNCSIVGGAVTVR
jgi:hypothetical protein